MTELFSFDDVFNIVQAVNPQKKHFKRRLVKAALLSQGIGNSQSAGEGSRAVDGEAILLFSIVLVERTFQVVGANSDPVHVFLAEGSDVEDHLPVANRLNRKRKASTDPIDTRVQPGITEGPVVVEEVLVLS